MQHVSRAFVMLSVLFVCCLPALTFAHKLSSKPAAPLVETGPSQSILRLGMPDTSPTVDPALVEDEENVQLANLLYSGLVRLDASYHVVPDAAQSVSLGKDHRTYTFHIRHGLRFSNGDPVTAGDFAYAITRSLNPSLKSAPAPIYLLDIQGASAVLEGKAKTVSGLKVKDPYTLIITARWPIPYFLMELTYPTSFALDKRVLGKLPADSSSWYGNPIGSGPFKLKSWSQNNQLVLVRNKYYSGTPPALKEIIISLAGLPDSNIYQYVNQQLDVVGLPSDDPNLRRQPGVQTKEMLSVAGLYLNMNNKPFDSRDVRRALTMSLNRPSLVTHAMGSLVTPFRGFVPPGEWGYDPGLKVLGYDPAAARAALKKSGYSGSKKFPSITLYYEQDAQSKVITKLVQSIVKAWHKNLGITVGIQALTANTLVAKAASGSLPLYVSGWSALYPDPHDWLSLQWRSNVVNNNVHYSSKSFDQLVERADVTWNASQRLHLYDQAQQQLVDDAAWIPLYIPERVEYIRPTVANVVLTGYGVIPRTGNWARVAMHPISLRSHRAF